MDKKKVWAPLVIAIIAIAGITTTVLLLNLGRLQVSIKDAPYDDLVSINVDISAIEIQEEGENRWISLMQGNTYCNCSVDGEEESICKTFLSAGTYDLIRIKFNHIRLRFNNDSLFEIDKYENKNLVQNFWLTIPIDFVYDGLGGKILFDITINDDYEAVVTIVQTDA